MSTPLVALATAACAAADYDPRSEAPPEAVLWCDPKVEFLPLLPALRRALPNLLTLGDYAPAQRQGPAIWLRAAMSRAVQGIAWDADAPAIVYLPGITRETLRSAEDCPKVLQLLAWLTVGSAVFGHPNGRDWTLRAFLAAKPAYGGLGLDVPQDDATLEALADAAPKLFERPFSDLQGHRLDAAWLRKLLVPDFSDDVLAWIGGSLTAESNPSRFSAFRAAMKQDLKLDPAKISPAVAAQRILRREKGWEVIWERFAKGGRGFHENAAAVLATIEPPADLLAAQGTIYAKVNQKEEAALRTALARLGDADEQTARDVVLRQATRHSERCDGPWAARGQARLAQAVQFLARLADTPALPNQTASDLASAYFRQGWEADNAVLSALEAVAPQPDSSALENLLEDRSAVIAALRALYAPRIEREASSLQKLLAAGVPPPEVAQDDDVVMFIDGLRMDLAKRLIGLLRLHGSKVVESWRWTGFPTVTATCKPLASPAAARLRGAEAAESFEPVASDGKRVSQPLLKRELAMLGWSTTKTLLPGERCWLEAGHFDSDGHEQQSRMVNGIGAALAAVTAEILALARAGRRVRVTTDHGWLLLPGGLPVAKLPMGLTETRWSRCAVVKDGAVSTTTRLPWTWNSEVSIATAPGAHVFLNGAEYAHGGISPQESIVPDLIVAPMAAPRHAVIVDAEWSGLRLRLRAESADGLMADIKLGADGECKSIADKPRETDADGRTSLLVPDDGNMGKPALIELREADGKVVATRATIVGD